MNRILIDGNINELCEVNDKTVIVTIKKDINLLINDIYDNYIFNIYDSNVNILGNVDNKAKIKFIFNIYSGTVIFNNFSCNLENEDININLNKNESIIGVYNSLISSCNTKCAVKVSHNACNTISNIHNNGVTIVNGSILFNVTSSVNKGYKKCNLIQDSKIISLNGNGNNKIEPILLIDEYDTEAKHSAYIGEFNKEQLFYMQTRGLPKKEASKLLLNGLLIGILRVSDEEKNKMSKKINNDWR